uniref:uncharacterized protein LOC120342841 n=1 Tax=Styela clava TaxID=7725 RepID=UPI00193A2028|nr:uncharacterized protein LOC120342841 [Styela clava]
MCGETEKFLQKKKSNLTSQEIGNIETKLRKNFELIYYGSEFENEEEDIEYGIHGSTFTLSDNYKDKIRRQQSWICKKQEPKKPNQEYRQGTPTKWIPELRNVTAEIRASIKLMQPKMTDSEKNKLQKLCKDTDEWCENNPYAKKREVDLERKKIEELWNNTLQKVETREINVYVGRSPNARYLLQPEDSKTALLKFARLARRKIHSPLYKTQIQESGKNQIITTHDKVNERVWTKERAEIELMEFKQLCIKVFKKVDENADPQRMDVERRWYY